jgi:hypothetical protein
MVRTRSFCWTESDRDGSQERCGFPLCITICIELLSVSGKALRVSSSTILHFHVSGSVSHVMYIVTDVGSSVLGDHSNLALRVQGPSRSCSQFAYSGQMMSQTAASTSVMSFHVLGRLGAISLARSFMMAQSVFFACASLSSLLYFGFAVDVFGCGKLDDSALRSLR